MRIWVRTILLSNGHHSNNQRFSWHLRNLWLDALALTAVFVIACGCIAGEAGARGWPYITRDVTRFARAQDLGVMVAKKRLRWQRLAPALSRNARRQLGRAFGGIWIDQSDRGRIKIGIAGTHFAGPSARAHASFASLGLMDAVDLVPVRYSDAYLKEVLNWMRVRIAHTNYGAARPMDFGLRPDRNVVELSRPPVDALTVSQRRFSTKVQRRYGRAVALRPYRGKLTQRACIYPYCPPPLRAGVRVAQYLAYNGEGCTGGFIAQGRAPDANLYQLSAGHCYKNEPWGTKSTSGYFQEIGPWKLKYEGTKGDAGKYLIANTSFWTPRAWVFVPRDSDEYKVFDDADPIAGQWLCTSGAMYGESSCGYVTQIPYYTSKGMSLVRASFCGQKGDSGAPVYANGIALGLQQGGFISPCDSTFTPIHAAEDVLSVDVLHEAPPPPPPPPPPICDPLSQSRIKIGDMNGDSRADIFRFTDPADSIGEAKVWRSEGTSYTPLGQVNTGFGVAFEDRLADWDGDGDDDVFQFTTYGRVDGWRSNSTSYTQLSQVGSEFAHPCETKIGDMNGDGKDDIFRFANSGNGYAWISNGTPTNYTYKGQIGTGFGFSNEVRVGDYDGDGDDDLFRFTNEGNGYLWRSNGTNYTSLGLFATGFGNPAQVRVGDKDGDGDDDLYQFTDEGNGYYWRSNGDGSYTYFSKVTSGFGLSRQIRIADINGDAKSDILWFKDDGTGYARFGDGSNWLPLEPIGSGFGVP